MNISRWRGLLVGVALTVLKAVEALLRPGTRRSGSHPHVVLVLEYRIPLGCCVHLTPLFEAIKTARPEATVIVATRGLGLDVLRHSPFVDVLLETPDPLTDLIASTRSLRRQLKQRGLQPDCCLTGMPDRRTRIAFLALFACRGWRGGYTLHPSLYHQPLTVDPRLSQIENNLRAAALVGATSQSIEPRVFYTAADLAQAELLLQASDQPARPVLIAVTQGSGGFRTTWHPSRWTQVLRYADQVLGYHVVYVGTEAHSEAIEQLQALAGGLGTSLAGRTTLNQLAALIAISDMVLSIDTGTMHVARAMRTPMIALEPAWHSPTEWMPLGKPHIRILRGPDRDDIPPDYQLDEISSDAAIAALEEMTRLYPPSPKARTSRAQHSLSPIDLLSQPLSRQ